MATVSPAPPSVPASGEVSVEMLPIRQQSPTAGPAAAPSVSPPPDQFGMPPRTTRQAQVRESLKTGSLIILATVAVGVLLIYLRFLLVPLVLAKFFHYLIDPFVRWLHRGRRPCSERVKCGCRNCLCLYPCTRSEACRQFWLLGRVPHWLAVTISLTMVIATIALVVLVIVLSVTQMVQGSGKYETRVKMAYNAAMTWAEIHYHFNQTEVSVINEVIANIPLSTLSSLAMGLASTIATLLSDGLMLVLFLIYMIYDGSNHVQEVQGRKSLREEADAQIRHYIFVKSLTSLLSGVLQGGTLFFLKVDLALVLGFMAFVLNFIPNVGPIIAILLPLPFVLLDPTLGWTNAILAIALPSTIHMLIGNFVEPKVLGRQMDLHPIVILCALVFWTAVWGAVGAVMSVPLTAVVRLWLQNIDHPICQTLANLLAEKPTQRRQSPGDTPEQRNGAHTEYLSNNSDKQCQ